MSLLTIKECSAQDGGGGHSERYRLCSSHSRYKGVCELSEGKIDDKNKK